MPTTPRGIDYPDSAGHTRLWEHLQTLAESVDAALDLHHRRVQHGATNTTAITSEWTVVATVEYPSPFVSPPSVTLTNQTAYSGSEPVHYALGVVTEVNFQIRAKCATSKTVQTVNWQAIGEPVP